MNSYAKWSGLAFQMVAAIGLCTWLGYWLDHRMGNGFPGFTVGLSLLGVIGSVYMVVKALLKQEKE